MDNVIIFPIGSCKPLHDHLQVKSNNSYFFIPCFFLHIKLLFLCNVIALNYFMCVCKRATGSYYIICWLALAMFLISMGKAKMLRTQNT